METTQTAILAGPESVRTVDVVVDEETCCPDFEYHFYDRSEHPPVLCGEIPPGFAGPLRPTPIGRTLRHGSTAFP